MFSMQLKLLYREIKMELNKVDRMRWKRLAGRENFELEKEKGKRHLDDNERFVFSCCPSQMFDLIYRVFLNDTPSALGTEDLNQTPAIGVENLIEPLPPIPTSTVCPPASSAVGVCRNGKVGESLSEAADGPMECFV
jgi:hypothetical protein